jgi:hypothetical protein
LQDLTVFVELLLRIKREWVGTVMTKQHKLNVIGGTCHLLRQRSAVAPGGEPQYEE